jgi:hypothetical protein
MHQLSMSRSWLSFHAIATSVLTAPTYAQAPKHTGDLTELSPHELTNVKDTTFAKRPQRAGSSRCAPAWT